LIPLTKRSLLTIIPRALGLLRKQRQAVKALPAQLARNRDWCRRMEQRIGAAQTPAQLAALWQAEIEPHIRHSVQGVLGSVSHAADFTSHLRRDLIPLVGADDADALTSGLSDDGQLLASLGPLVGLARVARGQMTREAYLATYGHRGPDEFELSAPRPAEDPDWLDQKLAQFRAAPADVEAMLAQQRAACEAAWDRLRANHPWRAKILQRRIAQVAPRARLRETARSEYARDRGLARTFALRAGALTGLGSGIFFLSVDEMLDLLAGDDHATRYIAARRETYQRYRALPRYPPIIRGRFDPFQWAADPQRRTDFYDARAPRRPDAPAADRSDRSNLITGSPGAAGRVEGRVRRLDRLEEGDCLQPGEVLVTAQTNVGWTFLFPRTVAIVTDVGAPLSHAAIVARELGIPAVVGCGDATLRLRTGDRVRVDGMQGTVEILDCRG
jgi:pyruvate,water dikinase